MIDDDVRRRLEGRSCLVTGGTGLIGRQVVDLLLAAGAGVRVVSLDRVPVPAGVDRLHGALADPRVCADAVRDMELVFHLAGIKGSVEVTRSRPASFLVPLLAMNTQLLEAARRAGIRQLVYTSSIGAYPSAEVFREEDASFDGPPMDQFPGWAKRMAELQIEAYRIEHAIRGYAIVRPSNVYGPGDNFDPASAMVVPSLLHRVARGDDPVVVWGDGSAVRDLVYSRDVAEGILLAIVHGTGEGFVNLGSGRGVSIKELVETLHEIVPFRFVFDPDKPSGFPRRVMDISRASALLGYAPGTSLRRGLEATWRWYLEHRSEGHGRHDAFAEGVA